MQQSLSLMTYLCYINAPDKLNLFTLMQTPSALHGEWHGMSLLFPMEKLFEAYVLSKVEKAYSDHYRIQRQRSNKYLCHHNGKDRFNLRPDIYFEAKNKNIHSPC